VAGGLGKRVGQREFESFSGRVQTLGKQPFLGCA